MSPALDDRIRFMETSTYAVTSSTDLSSLYNYLPSALKSRIPRLSSLRKTMKLAALSQQISRTKIPLPSKSYASGLYASGAGSTTELYYHPAPGHSAELVTRDQYFLMTNGGAETPMPSLTAAPSAASSRPDTPATIVDFSAQSSPTQSDSTNGESYQLAKVPHGHPENSVQPLNDLLDDPNSNMESLAPALGLLSLATRPNVSPDLKRPLLFDALYYLLRSLPPDLTDTEIQRFEEMIPKQVRIHNTTTRSESSKSKYEHSNLRSFVATTLINVFIGLALCLPYITRLFSAVYQFERRHQFLERIIVFFLGFVTTCGEQGVNVQEAVDKFAQSRSGRVVVDSISWTWHGVVGGLGDGVGEGVKILVDQTRQYRNEATGEERP